MRTTGIAGEVLNQRHGVTPGHVGIAHALQDVHGRVAAHRTLEHQVPTSVLDQSARDRHGFGRIVGRPHVHAFGLDRAPRGRVERRPQESLREVDRRRQQDQAGGRLAGGGELLRCQERQPTAHGGADEDLRAVRRRVEDGKGVLEPARDRAVLEPAAGFAMPGIIEADAGATLPGGPGVEGARLCRHHVGAEPAEPDDAGAVARPGADGDAPGRATLAEHQIFGLR